MSNQPRAEHPTAGTYAATKIQDDRGLQKGSLLIPLLLLGVTLLVFLPTAWTPPRILFGDDPFSILTGIPLFLEYQITVIGILTLFALIPGLAGLIYRRTFWGWFLPAFAIMFFANNLMVASGQGKIGVALREQVSDVVGIYLLIEATLIMMLLAFRLRRHSRSAIGRKTIRHNSIVAAVSLVSALGWYVGPASIQALGPTDFPALPYQALLFLVGCTVLWQTSRAAWTETMGRKNIVVCLDGTWNEPGTTDFGEAAETNVFKLFRMLDGGSPLGQRLRQHNASRCKQTARQIAFYYHGVGNKMESSALGQTLGGAFGLGASGIVDRAYLDVALAYRPGDRIFIFGFSRGAAIARLLASAIGTRRIPTSLWTLRVFGRHRVVSTSALRFTNVDVDVLGCWDTVGAFGIAKNILGIPFQQMNLLKDLSVSLSVKRAYHMVALDETRDAFVPTLMQPDPVHPERITEVWFSGDHSNIGGGHATRELSDITLDFLLRHVSGDYGRHDQSPGAWGLYLAENHGETVKIRPDPRGALRRSTGAMYAHAPRELPQNAVLHDTVFQRMKEASPLYAPQSLFDLNSALLLQRTHVEQEVHELVETGSLTEADAADVVAVIKSKLSIGRWNNEGSGSTKDIERRLQRIGDTSNDDNAV
jgi:hypothetical protein